MVNNKSHMRGSANWKCLLLLHNRKIYFYSTNALEGKSTKKHDIKSDGATSNWLRHVFPHFRQPVPIRLWFWQISHHMLINYPIMRLIFFIFLETFQVQNFPAHQTFPRTYKPKNTTWESRAKVKLQDERDHAKWNVLPLWFGFRIPRKRKNQLRALMKSKLLDLVHDVDMPPSIW